MDINKLIKDAHEMAVKKGFLENNNIPEKLMLIVSELGEAQEALRKNYHADWSNFNFYSHQNINDKKKQERFINNFEAYIKDTFEDEIADVYIRLADLCGYLHLQVENLIDDNSIIKRTSNKNISELLFILTRTVCNYGHYEVREVVDHWASVTFKLLNDFCEINNIDIDKHITAKMAYNATRPYKHGKAF